MRTIRSIALWLGLAASVATASLFAPFDRRTQILGAELIVVGEVVSLRSRWNDSGTMIVTDAEVAVEEVWKGFPAADRLTVRTPGGVLGERGVFVDGAARFHAGERVLLFLDETAEGYAPWGMRFGAWEVIGAGAEAFAVGSPPPAPAAAPAVVSLPLEDLRSEVAAALEGQGR
ncbi:MAG: hypothetical protein ACREQ9_26100 [Candidatus Binatia bacterium]